MEQALQAYIDGILNSPEYKAYALQKERVKKYPVLKQQIDEYRAGNFEMQTGKDLVFERMEAFEKEYQDFRENPLVNDFLAAELAFCRMIQSNNERIANALDFELQCRNLIHMEETYEGKRYCFNSM